MALKTVYVTDVPNLDQVQENATLTLDSCRFSKGVGDGDHDDTKKSFEFPKFVVIGHRGFGMNMLQSSDERVVSIKENSILSFNAAADFPIDYIEFDVQVTRDGYPVIFHDDFVFTQEKGAIVEKKVTDLTLTEFLSYGPPKEPGNVGKPLYRKTKDGRIFAWKVKKDNPLCTLQDAFQKVNHSVGFNIELKFDDNIVYKDEELIHILEAILEVVFGHAEDRPIIFSSFQPDAAQLVRKLQNTYPVFFLTNGGSETYVDTRRNSLDEAIKVCLEGGLQGIVSEVKAILRNPSSIARIKESKLSLITYGQLNNVSEAVYVQYLLGVEGVIVDLVKDITDVVSGFNDQTKDGEEESLKILEDELSFLLKLIPELTKQ